MQSSERLKVMFGNIRFLKGKYVVVKPKLCEPMANKIFAIQRSSTIGSEVCDMMPFSGECVALSTRALALVIEENSRSPEK